MRPDLEHPTREDVAPAMAALHVQPVPWIEPEEITAAVVFLAVGGGPPHHRLGHRRRRRRLGPVHRLSATATPRRPATGGAWPTPLRHGRPSGRFVSAAAGTARAELDVEPAGASPRTGRAPGSARSPASRGRSPRSGPTLEIMVMANGTRQAPARLAVDDQGGLTAPSRRGGSARPTTEGPDRHRCLGHHHVVVAEAVVVEDQPVVLDEQAQPRVLGARGVEHARRPPPAGRWWPPCPSPARPSAGATWPGSGDMGGK